MCVVSQSDDRGSSPVTAEKETRSWLAWFIFSVESWISFSFKTMRFNKVYLINHMSQKKKYIELTQKVFLLRYQSKISGLGFELTT